MTVLILLAGLLVAALALRRHRATADKPLFTDEQAVRHAWARAFPDLRAGTVDLTTGRAAALVMTSDGPGLIYATGRGRLLTGARARLMPTGLQLTLPEAGSPRLHLILPKGKAASWVKVIEARAQRQ